MHDVGCVGGWSWHGTRNNHQRADSLLLCIHDAYLRRYLAVHDPLDKTWEKHYFVLSKTHLTYGIPQEEAQDDEEDEEEDEGTGDTEEFGEEEEWYVA